MTTDRIVEADQMAVVDASEVPELVEKIELCKRLKSTGYPQEKSIHFWMQEHSFSGWTLSASLELERLSPEDVDQPALEEMIRFCYGRGWNVVTSVENGRAFAQIWDNQTHPVLAESSDVWCAFALALCGALEAANEQRC